MARADQEGGGGIVGKSSALKYYLLFSVPFLILIFVFQFPAPPWPDAVIYDSVARDFFKNGIFRYIIWGDLDPTYLRANFNNGPLYPALHLLLLKLFASTDPRILIFLNYVFAFLSIVNLKKILKLEGEQIWLLVILAFNPMFYLFTNLQRPEWLGIFIFSWIWLLLDKRNYWLISFLLALAALNHQFAIFFVPCIVYGVLRREKELAVRFRSLLKLFCGTLLFFSPYLIYIACHFADFKYQLFGNQVGHGTAGSILDLIKHFFTSFISRSMPIYTQTGSIPEWSARIFNVGSIFFVVSIVLMLKKRAKMSALTIEAGVFWFFFNIGLVLAPYFSPYVAFTLSAFAISLIRDVYPEGSKTLKKVLLTFVVLSIAYQLIFYWQVEKRLFNWHDMNNAIDCVADKLPENAKVYVMAYPDPSTLIVNKRNDIDIRRYIDFKGYEVPWQAVVKENDYFVVPADEGLVKHFAEFDHGSALRKELERGKFQPFTCKSGNIAFDLLSRKK